MMRRLLIGLGCLVGLVACGPIGGVEADDSAAGASSAGSGGSAAVTDPGLVAAGGARPANPHNRQALIWIWDNYRVAIATVLKNQNSVTHVSPAIYQMNYSYDSGVSRGVNANGYYDGLNGAAMATALHTAGIKVVPLIYAGAGNNGVDDGIRNIATNPTTAQNFIDAHVQEALTQGYDGWNLDWEVASATNEQYSPGLISFLTAFKAALNAHQMELSFDLGGWFVKQCTDSGGSGLVDLTTLGPAVDQAIIEDYSKTFGSVGLGSCPSTPPGEVDCGSFSDGLSVMCATTSNVVSIGLITPDSNLFAPQALDAIGSYGFKSVALWPDDSAFLNSTGIPNNQTWFDVFGGWLSQ
ncbi:MAG TPA: hypothetical protein VHV51_18350 [Polyangiaceae bacterium]|jgi:hypothetical protein|nr:hypothetical protein [Polyangiaceae bacterium]